MSFVSELLFFVSFEIVLQVLAWGTVGFFLFRLAGVDERHWRRECLAIISVFLLSEYRWSCLLVQLDLSIGNQEVLAIIGDDLEVLFEPSYWDIIWGPLEIIPGYMFGRFIYKKLTSRLVTD